jgi:hypothetical protein
LWRIFLVAVVFVPSVLALRSLQSDRAYVNHVSLVFTPPSLQGTRNVLLQSEPSLVTTADLVARELLTTSARAGLRGQGGSAGYDLVLIHEGNEEVPTWDKPVLELSVNGTSSEQVRVTTGLVEDAVRARLLRLQSAAGVPPVQLIGVSAVDAGLDDAPRVIGSPMRSDLAVAGLLLAASILLVGLLTRRWSRPHVTA